MTPSKKIEKDIKIQQAVCTQKNFFDIFRNGIT